MKKLAVFLFVVIAVGLIAVFVLSSQKESILRSGVQKIMEEATGLEVRIDDFSAPDWGHIKIGKIRLMNAPGFGSEILAVISGVSIEPEPGALLTGKIRCKRVHAEIERLVIEINAKSQVNLNVLAAVSGPVLEQTVRKSERTNPRFYIKHLELQFHTVELVEHLPGQPEPVITEIPVQEPRQVYDGLIDPRALIQLPVIKMIGVLNRGSLGIRRGKLLERIRQTTGVTLRR